MSLPTPPPGDRGPYGAPPQYAYVQLVAPQPRGLSVASLVLGLISLGLGFTFFVPIIGLILGIVGVRREPAGRGLSIAGIIINALMLLGWALAVIMIVVFSVGLFGLAATSANA